MIFVNTLLRKFNSLIIGYWSTLILPLVSQRDGYHFTGILKLVHN